MDDNKAMGRTVLGRSLPIRTHDQNRRNRHLLPTPLLLHPETFKPLPAPRLSYPPPIPRHTFPLKNETDPSPLGQPTDPPPRRPGLPGLVSNPEPTLQLPGRRDWRRHGNSELWRVDTELHGGDGVGQGSDSVPERPEAEAVDSRAGPGSRRVGQEAVVVPGPAARSRGVRRVWLEESEF